MKIGMVWYDNDPKKTLEDKVIEAAARYRQKHNGAVPTTGYVNPKAIEGKTAVIAGVTLLASNHLLPNHLWLEVEGLTP